MVDCWSFVSLVLSALQNPLEAKSLPLRHNLKFKEPFKYLVIYFTTIQCNGPTFDMIWLTVLITNAISAHVAIIAYMRDPTSALYGTPSISLCTFLNSSFENFNNLKFAMNGVLTGLHFFNVKTLQDLLDIVVLVHGDGMGFSIPLKFYSHAII